MFNIDSDKLYIYKKQYKFYNIFLLVRFYYLTTIILTKSSKSVFFFFTRQKSSKSQKTYHLNFQPVE